MTDFPEKLRHKLEERREQNALRELRNGSGLVDFVSNDYLGLAGDESVFRGAVGVVESTGNLHNGSTGSRLLSGNYGLYQKTEDHLARHYGAAAALIFNSGYDANLGLFSSVPQRGDVVVYDEFIHASMRDGIRMGLAKNYKYKHNDLSDLRELLERVMEYKEPDAQCYLATEAVFSMDGDQPDPGSLLSLCAEFGCKLILDEAHTVMGLDNSCSEWMNHPLSGQVVFARVVTFGKAMGVQGAAVLCDEELKSYLVNFARSLIYTTALPPMSIATVFYVCQQNELGRYDKEKEKLRLNIESFRKEMEQVGLKSRFIPSRSAIHSCLIPGNRRAKEVSAFLRARGYDVRHILAPTVPEGKERLRFCLHSFNTHDEIKEVLSILAYVIKENAHA